MRLRGNLEISLNTRVDGHSISLASRKPYRRVAPILLGVALRMLRVGHSEMNGMSEKPNIFNEINDFV